MACMTGHGGPPSRLRSRDAGARAGSHSAWPWCRLSAQAWRRSAGHVRRPHPCHRGPHPTGSLQPRLRRPVGVQQAHRLSAAHDARGRRWGHLSANVSRDRRSPEAVDTARVAVEEGELAKRPGPEDRAQHAGGGFRKGRGAGDAFPFDEAVARSDDGGVPGAMRRHGARMRRL